MEEKLIHIVREQIGKPYKYGVKSGEAPDCFDCSSFTQYVFYKLGKDIPRSTIEQAEFAGEKIDSIDDIKPGDLIFVRGSRGHYSPAFPEGIGHVGIYIGDNKIIHAEAAKRIQHNPGIIEIGQVKEENLSEYLERLSPVIAIKRIIE